MLNLWSTLTTLIGFLFRAYPTLMTHESSAQLMDQIFSSEDDESKARLLKILQDFLSSESAKHSAQEKGICSYNMVHLRPDYWNSRICKQEGFQGRGHGGFRWQYPWICRIWVRSSIMI
jgi:hypothetical protein